MGEMGESWAPRATLMIDVGPGVIADEVDAAKAMFDDLRKKAISPSRPQKSVYAGERGYGLSGYHKLQFQPALG